uniref:C2H2-type domain-containing protein n=1 Tax=Monodelphis domestica TaxID=13616 RepID=A0A5F8GIT6_MONDO
MGPWNTRNSQQSFPQIPIGATLPHVEASVSTLQLLPPTNTMAAPYAGSILPGTPPWWSTFIPILVRSPFCADCGRCFSQKMVAHRQTHSGERPYHCPECGRRFSQKSAIAKYQWIHGPGARGKRGQLAEVLPMQLTSVQGDLDPPVGFQHYPEIFQECG